MGNYKVFVEFTEDNGTGEVTSYDFERGTSSYTLSPSDQNYFTDVSLIYTAGGTTTPNNPPTISMTSPPNNAQFIQGQTISISANASDSDGSIAKVEFFVD